MKILELLQESSIAKGKKVFADNSSKVGIFAKKQFFDIRKAEDHEKVKITMIGKDEGVKYARKDEYFIRNHDDIEQVNLINHKEFKSQFKPVQADSEPDAEGFSLYREVGEFEAFQYEGEDLYIYTDWGTKQRLTNGDYLVRDSGEKESSGFVVLEQDFEKQFEEV